MKKNSANLILKITALASVLVFVLGVLIYGLTNDFGFSDLVNLVDDGVYDMPYTYEEEVKTLREIHVDWVSGPITVKFYDGDTVQVTETAKRALDEDEKLYLEVAGGELSVRWNSALLQIGIQRETSKQLEILIPRIFYDGLEKVDIASVSGNVEIDGMTAVETSFGTVSGVLFLSNIASESIRVETISGDVTCENISSTESLWVGSTSGNITLSGISAGAAELDNTSGEIVFAGAPTELECSTVSGNVQLDLTAWPEKMEINSVSGSADILAPETDDGFLCKFSTVSGEFESDFSMQKSGNLYQCGSGACSMELETTSGDVTLNRKVG